MPELEQTQDGTFNYVQSSFVGGMNLLLEDTSLATNQYKVGFDLTNRLDRLDPVLQSKRDPAVPVGIKQEMITFGNYVILFCAGLAYYRLYTSTGWTLIQGFKMSTQAPRFWTCAVPLATTNYVRFSAQSTGVNSSADPSQVIQLASVAGASAGNLPGLLVQDNINQPQFIFIDPSNGKPTVRTTQRFEQWLITFTDGNNTTIATNGDQREYVPIGNCMTYEDGVLYITSQDFNFIYRSVSGRPLDFVVNVINSLVDNTTTPPYTQKGGGDATTTSYSVGVGGITCLRPLSSGGIFVSASNANFAVQKNYSNLAPKIFGEYTFIKTFLFNATCLSDRTIIDTVGDTRFIDLVGIRSFNAVQQMSNEGRNSPFSSTIQLAFGPENSPIVQDAAKTAAILYNNYELYALNTIFGPVIAKYDTINSCWVSFDLQQVVGKGIKIFAKIELTILRLFAITEDDELYTLYLGSDVTSPSFRTVGLCSAPKLESKLQKSRAIINNITEDCTCDFTPYVNNRVAQGSQDKEITYEVANPASNDPLKLQDVDTQLMNILFTTPNCSQGWKTFGVFSWSNGSFTRFSMELQTLTPINPLSSQGTSQ